ncbi:P protein [Eumeta japonica]|uniref:P protein n=1 Tax=Eumeta variegata TaxID=151549 RepID=A0A4C1VX62_EUMVA|nr:P protein [Eumeta japonica]
MKISKTIQHYSVHANDFSFQPNLVMNPGVCTRSPCCVSLQGINFTNFTLHMTIGALLVAVQTYFQLRYIYRDTNKLRQSVPKDVQNLRQQIAIWRRAAASLPHCSQDEHIVRQALERKVLKLQKQLDEKIKETTKRACPKDTFQSTLDELKEKHKIRDRPLLVKSSLAIAFVVMLFFLHSLPDLQRISLGWTALLGAVLLLILADREDLEPILHRVEWSTLLFFASLFVLMEALSKLGLIAWIGGLTESIILSVNENNRLIVALMLMLWHSLGANELANHQRIDCLHSTPEESPVRCRTLGGNRISRREIGLTEGGRKEATGHAARNNTSPPFTANSMLALLQEAINNVQLEDWSKVVNKTERDIMSDWDRDIHIDNIMESSLIITVTDSDDEFSDNSDVSGLSSAFVDNIPLTTMMVRVVTGLGSNPSLGLPMAPLIWALSFGACLGDIEMLFSKASCFSHGFVILNFSVLFQGNGTLIGASANVVCAGVAEQHGYKITFMQFFRVGFPVMIGHLMVASVYLLVCHCAFTWH